MTNFWTNLAANAKVENQPLALQPRIPARFEPSADIIPKIKPPDLALHAEMEGDADIVSPQPVTNRPAALANNLPFLATIRDNQPALSGDPPHSLLSPPTPTQRLDVEADSSVPAIHPEQAISQPPTSPRADAPITPLIVSGSQIQESKPTRQRTEPATLASVAQPHIRESAETAIDFAPAEHTHPEQVSPPLSTQAQPPLPTIKVTIGRIELYAAPPARPQTKAPQPSARFQPQQTLDAYLKRRKGGAHE